MASHTLPFGAIPAAAAGHNPFWNPNMQGVGGPMMGGFFPYNQLAAYAVAHENALPMVSIAKLSSSNLHKGSTNSSLVVRSSLRKANASGGPLSVAEWTRKTLEENLEWLMKLAKRHASAEEAVFFTYGDGCETLLLLDGQVNKIPDDLSKIKKISIGCTMAEIESNLDEDALAKMGVLQPKDSIWEHLRFEIIGPANALVGSPPLKGLFIHTKASVLGESLDGRRRVLQAMTGPNHGYKPNPPFEQLILNKWKEVFPPAFPAPMVGMPPMTGLPIAPVTVEPPTAPPPAPVPASTTTEKETVITFNSKELLLLEKAFDNRLTERDTKSTAVKCTPQDKIAAQAVIRRANNEFVMRRRRSRKRKPTNGDSEATTTADPSSKTKKAKVDVPAAGSKEKAESKTASTNKSKPGASIAIPTKESISDPVQEESRDDDDVPISKMVSVKKQSDRDSLLSTSSSSPKKKAKEPSTSAPPEKATKTPQQKQATRGKTPQAKTVTTKTPQSKKVSNKTPQSKKEDGKGVPPNDTKEATPAGDVSKVLPVNGITKTPEEENDASKTLPAKEAPKSSRKSKVAAKTPQVKDTAEDPPTKADTKTPETAKVLPTKATTTRQKMAVVKKSSPVKAKTTVTKPKTAAKTPQAVSATKVQVKAASKTQKKPVATNSKESPKKETGRGKSKK